jgi:hypothetical protein
LFNNNAIFVEAEMSDIIRERERSTIGISFPIDVRRAIDRAAAQELCSAADIVRRYTLAGLRADGLIEEPSHEESSCGSAGMAERSDAGKLELYRLRRQHGTRHSE